MRVPCRQSAAVLIALFLAAQAASAYHYPLHSEAIRDAYFLGERNNFQTTDCLLEYIHRFTEPQAGPYYVSQIDISTPYQRIVLRGQRNTPGDSEVQTESELKDHPLNFVVRARIELNANNPRREYDVTSWPDFSRDVSIHVAQQHDLTPISATHEGLYNHHAFIGWLVELQFDPAKIASAPLRISVKATDGQVEETEFNMAKLQ